jgi:predicted secreted protein
MTIRAEADPTRARSDRGGYLESVASPPTPPGTEDSRPVTETQERIAVVLTIVAAAVIVVLMLVLT